MWVRPSLDDDDDDTRGAIKRCVLLLPPPQTDSHTTPLFKPHMCVYCAFPRAPHTQAHTIQPPHQKTARGVGANERAKLFNCGINSVIWILIQVKVILSAIPSERRERRRAHIKENLLYTPHSATSGPRRRCARTVLLPFIIFATVLLLLLFATSMRRGAVGNRATKTVWSPSEAHQERSASSYSRGGAVCVCAGWWWDVDGCAGETDMSGS